MNYGDINIFTLSPYENINVPFFNLKSPEIIIEMYNPTAPPTVIIKISEETVYQGNRLEKFVPTVLNDGITIKERGGLSDILIQIGLIHLILMLNIIQNIMFMLLNSHLQLRWIITLMPI